RRRHRHRRSRRQNTPSWPTLSPSSTEPSQNRGGAYERQTWEDIGSAQTHGESLVASGVEESRKEAEMVDDKCSIVEMIMAVAGQVAGQDAIVSIQNELAEKSFFSCFVAWEKRVRTRYLSNWG
ncbi:unnamed protein product, partial [Sphacelaria rigidula]